MKRTMIALIALAVAAPAFAKPVKVQGSVRKSGVYVMPHTRTAPNSKTWDNWSSKPNVNPTTGKTGTVNPWKPKGGK